MQAIQRITCAARCKSQPWPFALVLMTAAALLATTALADVELGIDEISEKNIHVEAPDSQPEPLRVKLQTVKASYKVDEPIRFHILGNKTFFLYLYSIDRDSDEVTLLLPTREGQRHNKYPANQTMVVPNEGQARFLADEPGRERVLMVASTRYLPLRSRWYREGADRYTGPGAGREFEKEFAEKGIRVRGPDKTRDDKVLVKTVMVHIEGETADERPAPEPVTSHVWLTTKGNRDSYTIGDRIEAVFGSGQDGWIHLYVLEPDGKHSRLKTYAVKEEQTYRARAVATDPAGRHALVAVYTEEERPPSGALAAGNAAKDVLDLDAEPKGVVLDEGPKNMAVYRFLIRDE